MSAFSVKTHTSVIVAAKAKGGVAGSMTCMMLAFEYAKRGAHVLVVGADRETQTADRWHGDIEASDPDAVVPFRFYPYNSMHGTLVSVGIALAKEHELDVLIYDLAADSKSALMLAKFADVMVGPTGPTRDDSSPLESLYFSVHAAAPDTPWRTLMTRVPDVGRGAAAITRRDLESKGVPVAATEIKRNAQQYSDQSGRLVTDTYAYADLADELNPFLKTTWTRKEGN